MSRLCFVVQRYGADISGGGERHCRDTASRLARKYEVTVLTTCANDYLTWKDHYPPGAQTDGAVKVIRFPVIRPRKVRAFGRLSTRLYRRAHSLSDEVVWMEKQGPDAPELLSYIRQHRDDYDLFIFYTYLYATTFFGLPLAADKALLQPLAHNEEPLAFGIFRYLFHLPRGFIFNTPEEKDLVVNAFNCGVKPSLVTGSGVELPGGDHPPSAEPYLLYAGRIDVMKGIPELLDFWRRYVSNRPDTPWSLHLCGDKAMPLPALPRMRYLGYLSDEAKNLALSQATALVAPSFLESLSISVLEAWARRKPVLANARSAVLAGQLRRCGGGLAYGSYREFESAMDSLTAEAAERLEMGRRGRDYVAAEYSWEVVERRYVDFLSPFLAA